MSWTTSESPLGTLTLSAGAAGLRSVQFPAECSDSARDLPIDQEQTPRYWAIIDESALLRVVGSPEIMQAQREYLTEIAQRPYVTIQVIANDQGPTGAYGRAFTVLVLQDNSSVVYLDITVAVFRSVTALQPSVVHDSMAPVTCRHPLPVRQGFRWRGLRGGCCSGASGRGPGGGAAMLTSGDGRRGGRG